MVYRLSGTGTERATLRVYLERFARDRLDGELQQVLADVIGRACALAEIEARTGRTAADVFT